MARKGFEILRTPEQKEAHKVYVDSLKREEIYEDIIRVNKGGGL